MEKIKDTITKLHNEIETCKRKYNALVEANSVMIEELQSVDEIMPIITKVVWVIHIQKKIRIRLYHLLMIT